MRRRFTSTEGKLASRHLKDIAKMFSRLSLRISNSFTMTAMGIKSQSILSKIWTLFSKVLTKRLSRRYTFKRSTANSRNYKKKVTPKNVMSFLSKITAHFPDMMPISRLSTL